MQLSEGAAVELLFTRLAKFGVKMARSDILAMLTLCRAQGWKFTARDPDTDMLDAASVTFGADSGVSSKETFWRRMWDQA